MAKEKEALVEETTATPEPEAETTETTKTFTQEDLDAIVSEKDKAYQGLQKVIARKDQELETSRKQPPTQSNTQAVKLLLELEEERANTPNELGEVRKPSPRIAQLKAEVRRLEQQEAGKRYQAQLESKRDEIRRKAEEKGIDPDSAEFYPVVDAYYTGNFPEAERRLARIPAKQEKEQKVGKTEEEIRVEERAKVIEELGLKKQDGGSPSGAGRGSFTAEEIGDMSYKVWVDAGKPGAKK